MGRAEGPPRPHAAGRPRGRYPRGGGAATINGAIAMMRTGEENVEVGDEEGDEGDELHRVGREDALAVAILLLLFLFVLLLAAAEAHCRPRRGPIKAIEGRRKVPTEARRAANLPHLAGVWITTNFAMWTPEGTCKVKGQGRVRNCQ